MGFSLLVQGNLGAAAIGGGAFTPFGSVGANPSNVEATSQVKYRIAGTLSNLAVLANATGTNRFVRLRKNTANGNQVVNPTNTTAGLYADGSNSDTIASTDLVDLSFASTGTPSYFWCRQLFKATTDHAAYYVVGRFGDYTAASTTYFEKPIGALADNAAATEATKKIKLRVAGTLQNSQAYVSAARATDTTIRDRINGSNGTVVITLTASTTGLFEDTSHTDPVASGDDICWGVTTGTGVDTLTIQFIGCAVGGISTPTNDIFTGQFDGVARAASGTSSFYLISGRIFATATEANAKMQHGFSCTTSRLRMYLTASTYTVDGVCVMRKNGADGAQTFPLTALTSGLFEDTTHSDTFAATDDACISINGGTTGSITIEWMGLTEQDTSATNVAITGVSGTGSIGNIGVLHKNPLTGIQGTGSVGTLAPIQRKAMTGVQGTGSVGTLGVTHKNALTGISATGSLGTLTPVTGKTIALTGISGTGGVGTLGVVHKNPLTGIQATGALGTLTPVTSGGAVSVALTGIQGRGFLGILSPFGGVQPGGHFIPLTEKQLREVKKRERRDSQLQRDLDHSRKLDTDTIEADIRAQMFPSGKITIIEHETVVETEEDEDEDLEILLMHA